MNVTLLQIAGQAAFTTCCRYYLSLAIAPALLAAATLSAGAETHSSLQAVTSVGTSAWNGAFPFTIRGVLLCNPDEMLDSTPNFLPWNDGANAYQLGAEWQVSIQAVDSGDRGGTTCWMGQSYGNMPWLHSSDLSYSNEAWVSEILRLNFDPSSLHQFRAGDLLEFTVRQALFYGGKRNINEAHDIDPSANFDIRLVTANHGLPAPEVITLSDVMQPGGDSNDWKTWPAIFDQTRATGAEHYQGMRVRINDLTLLTTNGWNPTNAWGARLCTVTDGAGRFFTLRHPRQSLGAAPTNQFDAIGIFNQESGSGSQGTNGYELFVQQVLPHNAAPSLVIGLNATITWPVSTDTYQLEWRDQADVGEWSPVTNAPVVINGMNTVILPPSNPQRFYQLRKAN
jgi:hypothetical protein